MSAWWVYVQLLVSILNQGFNQILTGTCVDFPLISRFLSYGDELWGSHRQKLSGSHGRSECRWVIWSGNSFHRTWAWRKLSVSCSCSSSPSQDAGYEATQMFFFMIWIKVWESSSPVFVWIWYHDFFYGCGWSQKIKMSVSLLIWARF